MNTTESRDIGRPYRGEPASARHFDRRARLIDGAIEVFGTIGYRASTVDKLCAAAGLTKRYFYESFDNSEDLLIAAYLQATDTMRDNIFRAARDCAPTSNPEAPLRAAITEFFTTVADDRRAARIAFVEILGVSARVDSIYRKTTGAFADTVLTIAAAGGGASGLDGAHRQILATGLVGATLMIAQQWLLTPEPEPLADVIVGAHTILAAVVFGRVDE